ncbi:metallophosphoesterase [Bacteroidota bacterium]
MTTRRQFIKRGFITAIGLVLLDTFWFEKSVINWKRIDLSDNIKNKIKLVQITDLHFKGIDQKHKMIAKKINSINPDILVFTGDSIDSDNYIYDFDKFLKLINHGIKKYSITGNWEYWGNVDINRLKKIYSHNNCELLINESRQIDLKSRTISIIGIDDYIGGQADFNKAKNNWILSDKTIVLSHCPGHRDIIAQEKGDCKIDLILSGHTHGGQVKIFGFVPFTPQGSGRYLNGLYDDYDPKLYVSKGVGTSILPIRFGARAEITIFDI